MYELNVLQLDQKRSYQGVKFELTQPLFSCSSLVFFPLQAEQVIVKPTLE